MTYAQRIRYAKNYQILLLLPFFMFLLWSPTTTFAADYFVWGRVYSATPLTTGEEPPNHELSGVPAEQIVGEGLIPQVTRNLLKIKVLAASDGSELGSYVTRHDGGYLVSFTATPSSGSDIAIRFVIEELATSKTLLESDELALSSWPTPNIRFLLIEEDLSEISGGGAVTTMAAPGQYTGIFTRVGKIELETDSVRLINIATGRATVPDPISGQLHIPAYKDSPFGGNLYLFGAFSQYFYGPTSPPDNPTIYYKIRIDDLGTSTTGYMDDTLVKTKYTVNFGAGTVDTQRVTLGPNDGGGLPGCIEAGVPVCYELTPMSAGANVFWSFPDLVALWRTGGLNGDYRLHLEQVGLNNSGMFQPFTDFTNLKLNLDNVAPVALINPLQTGDPDTPRVYTPNPANPTIGGDLMTMTSPLGSFPGDYGGSADPTCAILSLEEPSLGHHYLAFKLTASHDNGFLRYWDFLYKRNDTGYQRHIGKIFDGSTMVDYGTVQVASAETGQGGFQDRYLYLNSEYLQPGGGTDLGSCGYRFLIRATTRTTDGYHYLRYRSDEDIHYIVR